VLAAGGRTPAGVNLWDGAAWTAPGGGLTSSPDVWALNQYQGDLLVAGDFMVPGQADDFQVIRWNGATWTRLGDTLAATALGYGPDGDLIAGTLFTGPAWRWTGSSWSALYGRTGQYGLAVISYGGDLILGGSIEDPTPHGFGVARWTGSSWQGLGVGGPPGTTGRFALVVYQGDLIASGSQSAPMRWDGSQWEQMGHPGTSANALLVYNGDLIAGDTSVYRYAGSGWQSLGQVTGGVIYALAEYGGDLYVGGSFTAAGGIPAGNLARLVVVPCYANCDASPAPMALNVNDFVCFLARFAAQDPYADCNHDSAFNVNDFVCFQSAFAAGCP
jgi:hypothetical protein